MTATEKPLHIRQAEKLREMAEGMCQLAAMIEANPQIPVSYPKGTVSLTVWHAPSPEQMAVIARAALAHGAKVEKKIDDELYTLKVSWGSFTAHALAMRNDVCERVVTGTETVTKTVPDPAALAAVPTVEVVEEVEHVEWVCRPLLAAEKTTS